MADIDWGNETAVKEFILLGFGKLPVSQISLFMMLLVSYIATVTGNTLIVVLVVADQHLHTPMYFFLGNLSFLEICYSSTTLPKVLDNLLTANRTISVNGCLTQLYFLAVLGATECNLLAVMSYDRYLAICKPLHYSAINNIKFCLQLAASTWLIVFLTITIFIVYMSQFNFCGPNEIDHFYCDPILLLKLYCGDTHFIIVLNLILACGLSLPPFLLTLASYICIITTIMRIPSTRGRQKAFSTCFSHLTVVTIFYGTVISEYMVPSRDTLRGLKKALSVCYTVLTPLVNPLIYSLRNREVRQALSKVVSQYMTCPKNYRDTSFIT